MTDELDTTDFSVQSEDATPAKTKKVAAAPAVKRNPTSKKEHVVSGGFEDEVSVARLTADTARRKSLSVHHLQRRLAELGFNEAAAAQDGRYDTLTAISVEAWQKKNGYPLGALDFEQTEAIFDNDANVKVIP